MSRMLRMVPDRRSSRIQALAEFATHTLQHQGKPVSAGLREVYWRRWEGHHIPEFRVTIEDWKENIAPSARKTRP
jgi:hypothetical protein